MDLDDCYDSGADCSDYESSNCSDGGGDDYHGDDMIVEANDGDATKASAGFSTISKDDIERRLEGLIAEITSSLSVPRAAAVVLLVSNKWYSELVQENWFSDEEKMRRFLGLTMVASSSSAATEIYCKICWERISIPDFTSLDCGHNFCNECWRQYIKVGVGDGIACLTLRCPEPKCSVLVPKSTVETLAESEDIEKYSRILRRSYIEGKPNHKWCPAPDCENAVIFDAVERDDANKSNYDVVCLCSHEFCFNCSEEAHRPVDCETVEKWMRKNNSESENVTWILANTKPCPKCRKPIEKNLGCMHMTCKSPCNYQFCWLCLADWKKHNNYYSCNTYESKKQSGDLDEEQTKRENAKNLSDRYAHYFERWASNRSAMKRSIDDMRKLQSKHFESLEAAYSVTAKELECVEKAWMQIRECRRVLEWTYAYGFYLEGEKKKVRFECIQGEAELNLEKLHSWAEVEIKKFTNGECRDRAAAEELEKFHAYRLKLATLTNATRNHFEQLVTELENGMEGA